MLLISIFGIVYPWFVSFLFRGDLWFKLEASPQRLSIRGLQERFVHLPLILDPPLFYLSYFGSIISRVFLTIKIPNHYLSFQARANPLFLWILRRTSPNSSCRWTILRKRPRTLISLKEDPNSQHRLTFTDTTKINYRGCATKKWYTDISGSY